MKFLIFLMIFFHPVTSNRYTSEAIDSELSKIHNELVAEEEKLMHQMYDFHNSIWWANENLFKQYKGEQPVINRLTAALENLNNLFTEFSTLDDFVHYDSFKTCAGAYRKTAEIEFNIRQYNYLIAKVNSNVTRLTQHHGWVSYYYTLAYSTLINNGLEQQQTVEIVLATSNEFKEKFYNFSRLLEDAITEKTKINSYLTFYKRQFCLCSISPDANINSYLSTLEKNVEMIEKPLIEIQISILKAAKKALTKANTAAINLMGTSASSLYIQVDRTKTFLTGLVSVNDYQNIKWNSVNNCSDLHIRTGLIWFKYYQYQQTLIACNNNLTWTFTVPADDYKLNIVQLIVTKNLINALMKLEPLMQNYSSELNNSIAKIFKVWNDIRFYDGNYCGCKDAYAKTTQPTTTPTTTTISTTTTNNTLTPKPCALWTRFNLDDEPTRLGFKAGIGEDGSAVYIGQSYWPNSIIPVSIGKENQLRNVKAEYLVVQPSCICSWVPAAEAMTRVGLVTTADHYYAFAIGRVHFSDEKIAISKVYTKPPEYRLWQDYDVPYGYNYEKFASECLVCETFESTAGRPLITFQNEACGVWTNTRYNNDVTTHGFSAGNSIVNNQAYVGRGYGGGEYIVGRFSAEEGKTFVAELSEVPVNDSEYLIVPQGCTCKWMEPNVAWIRRGTIHSLDNVFYYAVGRAVVNSNQVSISKVEMTGLFRTTFTEYYAYTTNSRIGNKPAKEVLVCENIPDPPQNPCDLWVSYNELDTSPRINGVYAGVSAYKSAGYSEVWIARGVYENTTLGGRVQISEDIGEIYVSYGDEHITNPLKTSNGSGEYLVLRDNCTCSWMSPYLASNHPGLVRTTEQRRGDTYEPEIWGPYDFLISRITAPDGRVSIGRVTTPLYGMKYTDPTGKDIWYDVKSTEVLVCESTSDMSTRPTLKFGNEACALWTKYQRVNINWPATNGFSFGKDRTGNIGYVGRAGYHGLKYFGRINVGGTLPVVYVTAMDEPASHIVPEYLVIPNDCFCLWMPFESANESVGLVRSIDYSFGFGVGLVELPNNQFAVSSIQIDQNYEEYADELGMLRSGLPDVALVCETASQGNIIDDQI